jgi:probable rRNA maturation factor
MIELELQNVSQALEVPDARSFERWAEAALQREAAEIVIRVVDEDESAELNSQYRHKAGPTNVLSFPFEAPPGVDTTILGDLVICAPVVAREAREQGKALAAHWAHMVVHGVLHLQGYDHIDDAEAMKMEAEEIAIMGRLGFANPYEDET